MLKCLEASSALTYFYRYSHPYRYIYCVQTQEQAYLHDTGTSAGIVTLSRYSSRCRYRSNTGTGQGKGSALEGFIGACTLTAIIADICHPGQYLPLHPLRLPLPLPPGSGCRLLLLGNRQETAVFITRFIYRNHQHLGNMVLGCDIFLHLFHCFQW